MKIFRKWKIASEWRKICFVENAEKQTAIMQNFDSYYESDDYNLWMEDNDPAGLGYVEYSFAVQ